MYKQLQECFALIDKHKNDAYNKIYYDLKAKGIGVAT